MEDLKNIAVGMIVVGLVLMIVGLLVAKRAKGRRDLDGIDRRD